MTITAKFNSTCGRCGGRLMANTQVEWTRGVPATHLTEADCAASRAERNAAGQSFTLEPTTIDLKPIADFIIAARERGLKFPKARFLAPGGGELRLSLSGPGSSAPLNSLQVKVDDNWIGRVEPDGRVVGRQLASLPEVQRTLVQIALDPAAAAKAYGVLTGCCSYCNTPLTDEGSVEVGYGPICAKHYGLPHKPKGSKVLTSTIHPAFPIVPSTFVTEGAFGAFGE